MNVIVRIKVRQGQRRGLLRHGGRTDDMMRMQPIASAGLWGDGQTY